MLLRRGARIPPARHCQTLRHCPWLRPLRGPPRRGVDSLFGGRRYLAIALPTVFILFSCHDCCLPPARFSILPGYWSAAALTRRRTECVHRHEQLHHRTLPAPTCLPAMLGWPVTTVLARSEPRFAPRSRSSYFFFFELYLFRAVFSQEVRLLRLFLWQDLSALVSFSAFVTDFVMTGFGSPLSSRASLASSSAID